MEKTHSWIAASDVLSLFPTLVWKFELSAATRAEVDAGIETALAPLRPPVEAMTPGRAWQSQRDLHRLDGLRPLCGRIADAARAVLRFLHIDDDPVGITGCWANINPPGTVHRMHSHPNNFLSGVYYLRTPAGADRINFHDPRPQTAIIRPPVTALSAANTDEVVVTVSEGTLLLFPAWLPHSVDSNASAEERISLSFNLMFSHYTERMAPPLW
jgi:uncharacterized protein (TIGR02466 family)